MMMYYDVEVKPMQNKYLNLSIIPLTLTLTILYK